MIMDDVMSEMESLRKEYQALSNKFDHLKELVQRINVDVLFEETPQAKLELDKVKDLLTAPWGQEEKCGSESSDFALSDHHKLSLMESKSLDRYLDHLGVTFTQQEVMDAFNRFLERSAVKDQTLTPHSPSSPKIMSVDDYNPSSTSCENSDHSSPVKVEITSRLNNGLHEVHTIWQSMLAALESTSETSGSDATFPMSLTGSLDEVGLEDTVKTEIVDDRVDSNHRDGVNDDDDDDNDDDDDEEDDDHDEEDENYNVGRDMEDVLNFEDDDDDYDHDIDDDGVDDDDDDDNDDSHFESKSSASRRRTRACGKKPKAEGKSKKDDIKSEDILQDFGLPPDFLQSGSDLICPDCSKRYKQKSSFIEHLKYHKLGKDKKEEPEDDSKQESLLCTICGKTLKSQSSLQSHLRAHKVMDKGEYFKCHICSKEYLGQRNLQRHVLNVHTLPKSFVCDVCGKAFKHKFYLKDHLKYVHAETKSEVCPICNKCVSSRKNLVRHMTVHTEDLPYPCSMCGRRFRTSTTRNHHEIAHTGNFPYRCKLCDHRGFLSPGQLRTHEQKYHPLGEAGEEEGRKRTFRRRQMKRFSQFGAPLEPPKCETCGKEFKDMRTLSRHRLIHTGIKPHKCDMCGRLFATKAALNLHMWTHSEVKKYTCDTCHKGFNDKRNYVSHVRRLHPEHPQPVDLQQAPPVSQPAPTPVPTNHLPPPPPSHQQPQHQHQQQQPHQSQPQHQPPPPPPPPQHMEPLDYLEMGRTSDGFPYQQQQLPVPLPLVGRGFVPHHYPPLQR